jgi:hypothetical protein
MFIIIIIIIIIRNGVKTISLQTSFGDLIIIRNSAKKNKSPNRANTICLLKLHLGDIIRNGASTTRYDIIWLPNDGNQFANIIIYLETKFLPNRRIFVFWQPFLVQNGHHSKPKWSPYGAACLISCKYPFPLKSVHF